jgi:hypothetical protein
MSSSSKNFSPTNKESLDQGLYQANLDLWQRFVPGLANQFREFRGTSSQLLRNNEGDFNINHNGQMLLSMPSQKWAKKCAKDLRDGSNIFRVLNEPIGFPGIERDTIESMRQNANAKLTKPLEKFPTQSHSFHLVIFGSGLAEQIPLIAETTSCRNLIIVEPHVEFLYHSLYTFNWESVLNTFSQKNFKLTIIVENDPELVFIALADAVHTFAPHLNKGVTHL